MIESKYNNENLAEVKQKIDEEVVWERWSRQLLSKSDHHNSDKTDLDNNCLFLDKRRLQQDFSKGDVQETYSKIFNIEMNPQSSWKKYINNKIKVFGEPK